MNELPAEIDRNLRADGKDHLGRFAPGNAGKPRGAVSRVNRELLAKVDDLGPIAVQKLGEAVNRSDRWALEWVLNRLFPAGRCITFDDLTPDGIEEMLKTGRITSLEAKEAAETLFKIKGLKEIDVFRELLLKLETSHPRKR